LRNHTATTSGFTLIELVIVIVIMGILATGVTHVNTGQTAMTLAAQARALVSDLRYTQNLAMTKDARYKLVKASNTQYTISKIGSPTPSNDVLMKTVNLKSGTTFSSFPNGLIAFDTTGVPYTTGTSPGTLLTSSLVIVLTADGRTESVFVTPETGRVSQ